MKQQHLLNSFWLSLAAAVLSAQPTWALPMQVSAVRLNLNPNSNPLHFPTKPEEVRIQRTQPITLQQAAELAQRNNLSLQTSRLSLERSRAALREATGAEYPSLGIGADITHFSVR